MCWQAVKFPPLQSPNQKRQVNWFSLIRNQFNSGNQRAIFGQTERVILRELLGFHDGFWKRGGGRKASYKYQTMDAKKEIASSANKPKIPRRRTLELATYLHARERHPKLATKNIVSDIFSIVNQISTIVTQKRFYQ